MEVDFGVLLGLGGFLVSIVTVGIKLVQATRQSAAQLEALRQDVLALKSWRGDIDAFRGELTARERQALEDELARYRAAHLASLAPRPIPFTD